MNIFKYPHYISCAKNKLDQNYGFTYWELEKGEEVIEIKKKSNHIIFLISGELIIRCDQFDEIHMKTEQLVFLPNQSDCCYKTLSTVKILIFVFDTLINPYDKYAFQKLADRATNKEDTFQALEMKDILKSYALLLIDYIQKGLNCIDLHEEKQKELFILLRSIYTWEELLVFFYPLISHNTDFKEIVLEKYPKAKNVQELARLCGYNISDFRNKFLANFEEPAYQWMQKQKSKSIKFKLVTENIDLSTLSEELGFSSPAHFNKFCKRQFGVTPTQLKRHLREKENLMKV